MYFLWMVLRPLFTFWSGQEYGDSFEGVLCMFVRFFVGVSSSLFI